jgi:hypothetical protein
MLSGRYSYQRLIRPAFKDDISKRHAADNFTNHAADEHDRVYFTGYQGNNRDNDRDNDPEYYDANPEDGRVLAADLFRYGLLAYRLSFGGQQQINNDQQDVHR